MAEYIEREALLNRLKTKVKRITPIEKSRDMFYHDSGVNGALTRAMLEAENAPAADVAPVVRCKDCKHYHADTLSCDFTPHAKYYERPNWYEDDYCSYGERKEADGK